MHESYSNQIILVVMDKFILWRSHFYKTIQYPIDFSRALYTLQILYYSRLFLLIMQEHSSVHYSSEFIDNIAMKYIEFQKQFKYEILIIFMNKYLLWMHTILYLFINSWIWNQYTTNYEAGIVLDKVGCLLDYKELNTNLF